MMRALIGFSLCLFAGVAAAQPNSLPPPDACVPADIPAVQGFVISGDGTRLYYRKLGRGRPVAVYLHGGPGGTIYNGGCEIAGLARRFPIILYDQRGGGRSELVSDPARLTTSHHVDDLDAVRRHFGTRRVALFGLSWGSALATMYAARYPQHVSRLLLMAPMPIAKIPFDKEREDQIARIAGPELMRRRQELQRLMREASRPDETVELCRRVMQETPLPYTIDPARPQRELTGCDYPAEVIRNRGTVSRSTLQSMGDWDFRPMLASIKKPILVIEGAQTNVPLSSTRLWAAEPANGRLLLVKRAGHEVAMDRPNEVLKIAERFLAGGWPTGASRP